ncbi:MAG: type I-C CRISPR-associated protein Cas7/Csd2 [Deltaproteobacteria bacterium]|nr:type I-C CRISPR-associated protein Cas7/Csd2 [Deltaproteobacteria bacterium]
MAPLTHRYDMQLVFDCQDGNPNGDPDAGNMPRVDPETLHGLVSDVCQKRKVRDWVYLSRASDGSAAPGFDLLLGHTGLPMYGHATINSQIAQAFHLSLSAEDRAKLDALGGMPAVVQAADEGDDADPAETGDGTEKATGKRAPKAKNSDALKKLFKDFTKTYGAPAQKLLCASRFDVRTFGAVLSTGLNAGQVRGPVQCTFARSVDPVLTLDLSITRGMVTKDEDRAKKDREMGRKNILPYGVYRSQWFVSPMLANQTGFSAEDFKVLCDALLQMWELDRSAARGLMATRSLIVFEHASALGNARAHQLFERLNLRRIDVMKPPRSFNDYAVEVRRDGLPDGVRMFDLCQPEDYCRLFD